LAVGVDSRGTSSVSDDRLRAAIVDTFDFRPGAIIDQFQMRRPIYEPLSAYGHFGRTDLDLPWEKTDQVDALQQAVR